MSENERKSLEVGKYWKWLWIFGEDRMKVWIIGLGFLLHLSGTLMAREALQFACESKSLAALDERLQVAAQVKGFLEDIGFSQQILTHQTRFSSCDGDGNCQKDLSLQQVGLGNNADYRPSQYKNYSSFPLLTSKEADPQRARFLIPENAAREGQTDFSAVLILSDWKGVGGASIPMQCKADSVASEASETMTSAENELKRAQTIVSQQYGFSKLTLRVSLGALTEQIKAAQTCTDPRCVSFSQAAQLALAEILESRDHAESPLEVALTEVPREPGSWYHSDARKAAGQKALRSELDRTQTRFALYTGDEAPEIALPPEQGENADKNWIFSLYIPSLSDHFYWVVIDKSGRKKPYIYGFN